MGKFMDFMDTKGGGAAVGAAGGLIDNTIGMIGHNQRETQQANRQKEFMGIQQQNQKELNQQGHDLQMDMWNKTNYGAQMEHIKNAGLNPAMLYGNGGAGGATTGSQGGGSAGNGAAPNQMAPMDIGAGKGVIQGALAASQIKLQDSQANLNNIEANKKGGPDTEGQELQNSLAKIEIEIKNATKEDVIDKAVYEVELLISQKDLNDENAGLARAKVYESGTNAALNQMNTKLSEKARWKLGQDVAIGYENVAAKLADIMTKNNANTLRGMEGKATLKRIENDFVIDMAKNAVDWGKLNIQQQQVFVDGIKSIMGGILGARGTTTTTKTTPGNKQTTIYQN